MITAAEAAAERTKQELLRLNVQAIKSDEEILAEYCEAQRASARASIKMLLEGQKAEQDIMDYIKVHGSEDG